MDLNNVDEATRMVETIINLKREKIVDKEEALCAIKKVPHYSELFRGVGRRIVR